MAKRTQSASLDFAFFTHLHYFYTQNRGRIRQHYRDLTKKFLDYNDPENANAFLRRPQFEALEMYVFLKEFLDNAHVYAVFKDWQEQRGAFERRGRMAPPGQLDMFEELTREQYEEVFKRMRHSARAYPNYIFALTMGTGKTILMATCIFYEFILANKFPADPRYAHNALVFAPDRTVLQALREIQTFDKAQVVPPEYINWLNANIRFHFLEEAGTTLDTMDRSRFNLIVSNTQKIILKRQNKEKSPIAQLLGSGQPTYEPGSVYAEFADIYGFDQPDDEDSLSTNQRFEKLRRLEQLGIYIDEAHHAFGNKLAADMGIKKSNTSLRLTVDELAASLERAGTRVVACYNYTGTPYAGQEIFPEVVYAFSLQDAIDAEYLKQIVTTGYDRTRNEEFIDLVIEDFLTHNGDGRRHEGMLPKLAFFAGTIEELNTDLRPAVEAALARHGISPRRILVNVGDPKHTSDDDIREFNRLDTAQSEKQFILLVNKGREGWNCRSLFGVALYRKPRSKIFVLQASMRCLRAIGETQQVGRVYLSHENKEILQDELQQNFRVTLEQIESIGKERVTRRIQVAEPVETVRLKRVRKLFQVREKPLPPGYSLELDKADRERYRLLRSTSGGLDLTAGQVEDISHRRRQRQFTPLTLVAEIARYLNKPPLAIEEILDGTAEGLPAVVADVNGFNELLYDWVIPRLFTALFDIDDYEKTEEYTVELVKVPEKGYYEVRGLQELLLEREKVAGPEAAKSFHLDAYLFDSRPELKLFRHLLQDGQVEKVFFTGMLTHGQSDFYVQYIDPESHTIRSYYPDFLFRRADGLYIIAEVKGDNKIDDPVVKAKSDFAADMAAASGMRYGIIKGSEVEAGNYRFLVEGLARPAGTEVLL